MNPTPQSNGHSGSKDPDAVARNIESFLRKRFRIADDDAGFSRKSSLWEEGYVDSIGVVELIAHIESTFAVALPDEALFDPAFKTVDGIASIVCGLPDRPAA